MSTSWTYCHTDRLSKHLIQSTDHPYFTAVSSWLTLIALLRLRARKAAETLRLRSSQERGVKGHRSWDSERACANIMHDGDNKIKSDSYWLMVSGMVPGSTFWFQALLTSCTHHAYSVTVKKILIMTRPGNCDTCGLGQVTIAIPSVK